MNYYELIKMIPELLYAQRFAASGLAVTCAFAISLIFYVASEAHR